VDLALVLDRHLRYVMRYIINNMKRIILSAVVLAFTLAVQAGDAKTSQNKDKDKPACCANMGKTSDQAKGTCPFAKSGCSKAAPVKQTALLSPKAADNRR
jgi:hypothetical protein